MSDCLACGSWLDGALSPAQRADFEAHLACCQRCQEEVAQWRALGASLRAAHPEDHQPPAAALITRLVARAADEPQASPSLARWWPAAVAAVALAAGVALVLVPRSRPEPSVAQMLQGEHATLGGGLVETAPGGRALFALGVDTVGVGADSRVKIERADREATSLRLERGTLAVEVDRDRGPRAFDVATALAVVHVTGTVFRLTITTDQLRAEVLRGEVEVRPAGREALRVAAGGTVVVTESTIVRAPLDATSFPELAMNPVGPQTALAADAGAPAGDERRAPRINPPAVSKTKSQWRSRAARGECPAVIPEVQRALAVDGNDADLWLLLGDCHRNAARPAEAVEAYLRAAGVKGRPQNRGRLLAASILQDDLAQNARALVVLEAYLAAGAEGPALEAAARVRKARLQGVLGKERQARAGFQFVIEHFPDTPAAAEALRLLAAQPPGPPKPTETTSPQSPPAPEKAEP